MDGISVIICAAGRGERAGFKRNKLLVPFLGANALYFTLKKFSSFGEIIVTANHEDFEEIKELSSRFGAKTVLGGSTRTESVFNALKEVTRETVLIHDGARPFVTEDIIKRCAEEAERYKSAVVAAPSTDTTAIVSGGCIDNIPARNAVYRIQTPQGFRTEEIKLAYEKAVASGKLYTDDSSVYTEYIAPARICACGSDANKKLTFREDFTEALPPLPACKNAKIGFGADVHAFGKEQDFIMLCGVKIASDTGLVAHSDGDVVLHAVTDAVLSAAGLNDIGHYFPENDLAYENADSGKLLKTAIETIGKSGLKVVNLSVSVQAEKPRLKPYIEEMKENLAYLAGVDKKSVAIAAGTCEGLGFVGEGLGITAYCIAQLNGENDGKN